MPADAYTIGLRLLLALFAGVVIGLNRDLRNKPAGVRTHALVGLGTALMVLVILPPGRPDDAPADALSRVIQGVLTGIGFLGAGVILRDPSSGHVTGLTTAAAIWLTSLIGVACATGRYAAAGCALALGLLAIHLGGPLERGFRRLSSRHRKQPRQAPARDVD